MLHVLDLGKILGGRGRNRINSQTQFQQHAGQRMTLKAMQNSVNRINRARIERLFYCHFP